MPGAVLISRNQGWPCASIIRSTRPQSLPPRISNARRASCWMRCSSWAARPHGMVLRIVGDVLRVIVVELAGGHDADHRQFERARNRYGVLAAAFYAFFDQYG